MYALVMDITLPKKKKCELEPPQQMYDEGIMHLTTPLYGTHPHIPQLPLLTTPSPPPHPMGAIQLQVLKRGGHTARVR